MLRLTVPTGFTVAAAFDACEARVAYHQGTTSQPKTISFALGLEGEPTPKIYLCCIGIMENLKLYKCIHFFYTMYLYQYDLTKIVFPKF